MNSRHSTSIKARKFVRFQSLAISIASCLFMAACATQSHPDSGSTPSPVTMHDAGEDIFLSLDEGGVWHPASKGQCPAQLADFEFRETSVFNADGSDVACQYGRSDGTTLTVYFYQHDDLKTAQSAAQVAGDAIMQAFPHANYLKEESRSCTTHIDLMAGLSDAMITEGGDTTIEVGKTPCFMFDISTGTAAVATDMIGPWHLKIRLTGSQTGADITELQMAVAEVLILERSSMSGQPGTYLGKLLHPSDE